MDKKTKNTKIMRILFDENHPLVINWDERTEKPKLRDDVRGKVLFYVYKLKKGFHDQKSYGFNVQPDNTYYGSGCYVIPIILHAHRWFSGNKVVMSLPSGLFGMFSMGPIVHGVEKKDYEAAENFRHYYGICSNWSCGYDYLAEDTELYDNVQEAIKNAKHQNATVYKKKFHCHCGETLYARDKANTLKCYKDLDQNVYICRNCGSFNFF